ncbi:MAG: TIGR02147 family protein [Proteobacteria bacterium]|nr:MAG: TIGR02147 family protein [Pseudomonadota bacterium]
MNSSFESAWLLAEFKQRKIKNAAYSLRAFSRAAKVSPGRLSEYLAGKRPLTPKVATKIAGELGTTRRGRQEFSTVEDETFAVVADWQHFAILSLMETKAFRSDEKWIARRLGISALEAREALARLLRTGLVVMRGKDYIPSGKNLSTSEDIPSAALRRSHRQSLEQAIDSLENVSVERRDISSVTMAIDAAKLPLAKAAIREFRRKLMNLLETGDANEVYNLNIQLHPLTLEEKK